MSRRLSSDITIDDVLLTLSFCYSRHVPMEPVEYSKYDFSIGICCPKCFSERYIHNDVVPNQKYCTVCGQRLVPIVDKEMPAASELTFPFILKELANYLELDKRANTIEIMASSGFYEKVCPCCYHNNKHTVINPLQRFCHECGKKFFA